MQLVQVICQKTSEKNIEVNYFSSFLIHLQATEKTLLCLFRTVYYNQKLQRYDQGIVCAIQVIELIEEHQWLLEDLVY